MEERPTQIADHDPPVAEPNRRHRRRFASPSPIDSRSQCHGGSIASPGQPRLGFYLRTQPSPAFFRTSAPKIKMPCNYLQHGTPFPEPTLTLSSSLSNKPASIPPPL